MAKQVFAVLLDEPSPQVVERLKAAYKSGTFSHTDCFHLVAVGATVLTRTVATKIGLYDEDGSPGGVVIRVDVTAYAGYTNPTLWEWIKQHNGN